MRVHIYFKNEDEGSLKTHRVTMPKDSDVKPRVLMLGTAPQVTEFKLEDIESFWIEED